MTFILASNNQKKLIELEAIMRRLGHEAVSLEQAGVISEPEETGQTFEANALIKARAACRASGLPAIADDSGLTVDALGGAPGVRSARYCEGRDRDRTLFLLENMKGVPDDARTATFTSAIGCVLPGEETREIVVRGDCMGVILSEERGIGGFGYDPVFYVPEVGKTYSEMSQDEKNRVSHRARALARLEEKLCELGI